MLQEAMALFIEGCCEEGIMDRVLDESGLELLVRADAPVRDVPVDMVPVPLPTPPG